jgi:hypothetical protein
MMSVSQITNKNSLKKSKTTVKARRPQPGRRRTVSKTKRSRLDTALHKRIILHPISLFFLLCVGIVMAGMTFHSFADSFTVTAKVSAPLPTMAASITSPTDQAHVATEVVTVRGICPANTYMKLYRQDVFSGMQVCGSSDTVFNIDVALQPGANNLYSRVFNLTDDEGPQSATITVWYDVPAQPYTGSSSPSIYPTTGTTAPDLAIVTEAYQYQVYEAGHLITWTLRLENGTPPYTIIIDWGDGSTTVTSKNDNSPFEISHSYLPKVKGDSTYVIKLAATDAKGVKTLMQLSVVVKASGEPVISGSTSGNDDGGVNTSVPMWLKLAWPTYGVVSLMAVSFWLGERQELFTLFNHSGPKPRLHRHR